MKIIFLDFDGVLNNSDFIRAGGDVRNELDSKCVENLNRITRAVPDAKIIISSTWRLLYKMDWLMKFLKDQGVEGTVEGKTGEYTIEKNGLYLAKDRGEEIKCWLKEHPEVKTFVSLDDDLSVIDTFEDNHVLTIFFDGGLTIECSEKAIKILKN